MGDTTVHLKKKSSFLIMLNKSSI